ncbi:MAG: glycoside hydrolase family 3 C-terminal domain-containing protein, partial [Clostridiales bacterium]|nr:glycoside hydrolase family 3 C-terminal domain-containing protein [Clostridiales bacterium]
MNIFKQMFKRRATRTWFIVTAAVLTLMIVINVVATSTSIYGLLCILLGRERAILADGAQQVYAHTYGTKAEARAAGEALNERIVEEGAVLLKNEGALPLSKGAKISVFGKNSVSLVYGGSGSGGGTHEGAKTIFDSLTKAGFSYNAALKAFYESKDSGEGRSKELSIEDKGKTKFLYTGETPQSSYTQAVKDSYAAHKDAALVVFSRIGGEGWDLPRVPRNGAEHYLQLDENERDLLKAVCGAGFPKVIVVLNTNNPIELGFLDDPSHPAYDARINGCLWIGTPGDSGI